MDYSGQDRRCGILGLTDIQFCILIVTRLATAVLQDRKKRSTDNQSTKHYNDNHSFDSDLQEMYSEKVFCNIDTAQEQKVSVIW